MLSSCLFYDLTLCLPSWLRDAADPTEAASYAQPIALQPRLATYEMIARDITGQIIIGGSPFRTTMTMLP